MATNFPSSLDSLTNPTSTDQLSSPSHADQHANVNDAVEALEAKVGVDGSAVTSSHDYKIGQLETNAVVKTLVDAKGDLIVGSGADAVARLAVGSNGDLLVADSGATNGVRWQGQTNTGRNLVINGAMQVAQRGTSTAGITSSGYYTADRWRQANITLGTLTQSVETDAPTGSGFRNSAKVLITTADASPAAGDVLIWSQRFEGQDLQRVKKGTSNAEQLTVSFWVKANVTGTYIVELEDTDNTRYVSASYSVSASATWEKKTLTFPADTTGTWNNDNAESLRLNFWLGSGSNNTSGTLGTTWHTTVANRAVGQTNLAAAIDNYWQITGVQLEVGPVATGFDFEPYETTLRKCQRYYFKSPAASRIPALKHRESDRLRANAAFFPVTMRAAPTITIVDYANDLGGAATAGTATAYCFYFSSLATADDQAPWLKEFTAAIEL